MSRFSAACPWSPATLTSWTRSSCKHIPGRTAARPVLIFAAYLLLSCLVCLGLAQGIDDPVEKFCRRFGHQTALIDRKLYIDGGTINYNPLTDSESTNRTNTFLSYIDLDVNGAKDMPQLYANLSKNASIPSVSGGVLWADDVNKIFHLFGGESPDNPPSAFSLYSYDAINDYWTTPSRAPPQTIQGVSFGAGIAISETGKGYYYGGWLNANSTAGWSGPSMATTSLIQYTMDTNQWDNSSGPADNIGRAEGVMVYLPISDQGMLVYFGGIQDQRNGSFIGQPMDEIHLYDLATSRWYVQHAEGDVPEMRRRFCAGATWSDDQSSFNIYLYGGLGFGNEGAGFDDVYILSLPSFTWIKMYPAPGSNVQQQYPHNMLSCNVIDKGQMLIIGGSFPLDQTTCDAPEQFGEHGLDMGLQNPGKSPWYVYRKNITEYIVPGPITDEIGGNAQGHATKMEPSKGFDAPDLSILMTRRYTPEKRLPSRVLPSQSGGGSSLSTGAIAGVAVGCSAAALLGAFTCCWYFVRRHKRRKTAAAAPGGGMTETSDHYGKPRGPPSTAAIYSHDGSNISGLGSPRSLSSYQHTPASPAFSSLYPTQMPGRPAELAGDDALYEVDAPQHPVSPGSTAVMTPKASAGPGFHLDPGGAGQAGFTSELPGGQMGGMAWDDGSPHETSLRHQQQGLAPESGYAANHGATGLGLPSPDRLTTDFSDGDDRGGSPDDTRPRPHQTYYHE